MFRIGIGFDVHKFAEERKCIIGGVEIPHSKGLLGHSDADVLTHAICDALLGAAGLGDIGTYFPDNDPKFKNIDSQILLSAVKDEISKHGFKIENIDSVVMAEQPKINPHRQKMKTALSKTLEIEEAKIGIKATTTEKLGFTGRGEGIAAQAVALLSRVSFMLLFVISIFACSRDKEEEIFSSSSSSLSSSSSSEPQLTTLSYQGKTYELIRIGSQTWIAENLNAKPSSGNSWCYADRENYCAKYGKLYDWEAANSVCPNGWKLPSKEDYNDLLDYGLDQYMSSAILGGFRTSDGDCAMQEEEAYWWTSSESDALNANYRMIKKEENNLYSGPGKKTQGFSVRCIKL